jgi:hypothetical protein
MSRMLTISLQAVLIYGRLENFRASCSNEKSNPVIWWTCANVWEKSADYNVTRQAGAPGNYETLLNFYQAI